MILRQIVFFPENCHLIEGKKIRKEAPGDITVPTHTDSNSEIIANDGPHTYRVKQQNKSFSFELITYKRYKTLSLLLVVQGPKEKRKDSNRLMDKQKRDSQNTPALNEFKKELSYQSLIIIIYY